MKPSRFTEEQITPCRRRTSSGGFPIKPAPVSICFTSQDRDVIIPAIEGRALRWIGQRKLT
jgi:hypothetical protein